MIQRTLELQYDQLVIGSDLSALSYCYINKCPTIFLTVDRPYEYNEKGIWEEDIALWNDMAYMLSNDKYIPFSDKIISIRLENEKQLKIITKFGLSATVNFKKLIISNDKNIEGLPPPISKTNYDNWVIDWFDVNVGVLHDLWFIDDKENDFVKKIYFYISQRFYKNVTKKDLLSVSKITDQNLNSDDYNHNIARIKTIKMMIDAGIKGRWDKINENYVKPRLTSVKRDIYPLGKNIYNNLPNNISILYEQHNNILLNADYDEKWHKLVESRYLWNK
jgi:hypothetical protein